MAHHYATPRTAKRDQDHINAAYRHARQIIRELSLVRGLDGGLARVLREMNTVEDVLCQYAGALEKTQIKEG